MILKKRSANDFYNPYKKSKMVEQEEYEKIIDQSKTGFEKITDKGLVNFHSSDVRDGDRVVAESNRRLKKAINTFNENSSKQTKWIIRLTVAMLLVGLAQIGLFFYSLFTQA